MSPKPSSRKETGFLPYLGPFLIFVTAASFYYHAGSLDEAASPGQLGPGFWPKVTLILLMVGCAIKALEIYFSGGEGETSAVGMPPLPPVNFSKLAIMIGLVLLVVLGMEKIGFLLANLLFLLIFMRVAGVKRKFLLFSTSVVGTLFLLFLFVKIVYLPLPRGQGIFHDLTLAIYRIFHLI